LPHQPVELQEDGSTLCLRSGVPHTDEVHQGGVDLRSACRARPRRLNAKANVMRASAAVAHRPGSRT
jgi:hypothetical protein